MDGGIPLTSTVRFVDVTDEVDTLIGEVVLPPFTGCGTMREASVIWPDLSPGLHTMRVEVDSEERILETSESNNVMTTTILIGTYGTYLPFASRGGW